MPIYPKMFDVYCKQSGLKAAFVSEIPPSRESDCKNCGGLGTLIIFLATEGPYDFPPSGIVEKSKTVNGEFVPAKQIIAKFVNGKWWGGKSVEEMCPVCHGLAIDPNYVAKPVRQRKLALPDMAIEKVDYTDV
jgi:hypothetical protein